MRKGDTGLLYAFDNFSITVLVHAAAGGTGQMIVKMCKHLGAVVIGTCSTKAKAESAKRAGADHVIIYTEQDILEQVNKITANAGVDCVFDGVGKSTFDTSLACIKRLGALFLILTC